MAISITMLRLLTEALDELGLDSRALLAECEINPEQLQDPDTRISPESFERVWLGAQEKSGHAHIGLLAGERINVRAVNLFGYLMLSSATVGAGIKRVARYQRVLTETPWVEFDDADPKHLQVGVPFGGNELRAIHAEYVAALILRIMDWVSKPDATPESVSFRHEARGPLSDYTRVLRCNVKFGAERNELGFSQEVLDRPSQHAEQSIALLHEEFAERLLADRAEVEFSQRVRRLLAEYLETGETDLRYVARQLGMGSRSLQRRLADEGTSFSALLDDLRCEIAREHLERYQTPIAGVAHLAGFSDVSAFTRAASRWFGDTPARFRERAGRRGSSEIH